MPVYHYLSFTKNFPLKVVTFNNKIWWIENKTKLPMKNIITVQIIKDEITGGSVEIHGFFSKGDAIQIVNRILGK